MSKISNLRLPNAATGSYSPEQFNQLVRSLEQVVFELNTSYSPNVTEDKITELDWYTGTPGNVNRSTLEDTSTFAHGAFADFTDQTCSTVETATAITWDTTAYAKHIAIDSVDSSKVVFAKSGRYKIDFTAQLSSASANAKTFWFWPRLNGTDVTGSTMRITVHDNEEAKTVARTGIFEVDSGDYLQAYWAVDDTDTSLQTYAAETFAPAVPSVTLMITSIQHG